MKKLFIFTLAIFVAGSLFGQGIAGSAHDFSGSGWAGGEICLPCHTPHNADTTITGAPLWNHEVTAVATFTVYTGLDMQATVGQPDGVSKLCLSCHDGTVALDNYGGATGGTNFISTGLVGTDLSNDHPISMDYQSAIDNGDNELNPTTTAALGGTIASEMLFGGNVECASCHDVHNRDGNANLLVISNAGSALCLTCHDK